MYFFSVCMRVWMQIVCVFVCVWYCSLSECVCNAMARSQTAWHRTPGINISQLNFKLKNTFSSKTKSLFQRHTIEKLCIPVYLELKMCLSGRKCLCGMCLQGKPNALCKKCTLITQIQSCNKNDIIQTFNIFLLTVIFLT